MATTINLIVPAIPVGNADVAFAIWQQGELLGTMKISRGGIDWYKRKAKTRTGRATWQQFKEWMES
ncbi:MAG: hypothetical protein M0Z69_03625 [Actinomycetota bacterium]|nr:hypothetical protein [Actinomycetota bacterium]